MTAPPALLEFFRTEASEYLDQLEKLLDQSVGAAPEPSAFLAGTRALRGSASMTRLDGLAGLASTVERIATGIRNAELEWNGQLQLAVRNALAQLRDLVARTSSWGEAEKEQCRAQAAALASVAMGYLATSAPATSPAAPVVPISRLFPSGQQPAVVYRNPRPHITLAQRFRSDIAAAASSVLREAETLATSKTGPSQLALADAVRRTLIGLSDVAESYSASSISSLATQMARAPLTLSSERAAVQAFAQLLMNRELSDAELAGQVRQAALAWSGSPAAEPLVVPIETLLYRGHSAIARAREVRQVLRLHWERGTTASPEAYVLFDELSDLLDLATTI